VFAYNRISSIFFAIGIVLLHVAAAEPKTPARPASPRLSCKNRQMGRLPWACGAASRQTWPPLRFGFPALGGHGRRLSFADRQYHRPQSSGQSHIVDCFMVVVPSAVWAISRGTVFPRPSALVSLTQVPATPFRAQSWAKSPSLPPLSFFLQWRPGGHFLPPVGRWTLEG